ncbi:MAG: TolC family protein [Chloroherpetonaceae bacterium]|nr:TolC family protein [Chloroherpetonaceae bacterium]
MLIIYFFFLQFFIPQPQEDSISVSQAVSQAISRSLSLKQQTAYLKAGFYQSLQDVSPDKPTVSFYTEEMLNGPNEIQSVNRWQISQKFEFPLVYLAKINRLDHLSNAMDYELEEMKVGLAFQVRVLYWEVKLRESLLQISREGLEMAESFQKSTEKLFEFGEVSKLQALRAKIEVEKAKSKLFDAQKSLESIQFQFLIVVGDSLKKQLTDSFQNAIPNLKLTDLLRFGETFHPKSKKLESKKLAASELKSAAVFSLFPSISFSYFSQKFTPSDNTSQRFAGGEVSLSFPLWAWLGDRGSIGEKSNVEDALRYEYEYWREIQQKQITSSFKQYEINRTQLLEMQSLLIPASEEGFRLAISKYEKGEIGYLELLDSRSVVLESKELLVTKQFEVMKSYAELLKSIGKIEEEINENK